MAFLEGFLLGLGTIIFIGPVVFTLLKGTMQYGFMAGMSVALGIIVSDVICVLLCSLGAVRFFKNPDNQFWLAIGGGLILLALGLKYIIKPGVENIDDQVKIKSQQYTGLFVSGFLVNFVNPFVFLVWIGFIGRGQLKYGTDDLIIYLTAILLGIFTIDTLKVIFAQKLSAFIQPNYLSVVYRVIGVLLVGFSVRLFLFAM